LHSWLDAANRQESGVVDFDGNGIVNASDPPPTSLQDVQAEWIFAFETKRGKSIFSPWYDNVQLFQSANVAVSGAITLSQVNQARGIVIRGYDKDQREIYKDSVSID
jgi:hypothetical protein